MSVLEYDCYQIGTKAGLQKASQAAMDTHFAMRVFDKVVELGSFSAAADRLELARPTVTKIVAFLERKYGVRLLNRTTRRLSLTDVGRAFHERSRAILADIDEMELALQSDTVRPSGKLRIAAPFTFGALHLGPAVNAFMRKYPEVFVDVELSDRAVDLVEEGFDLALRIGNLGDSSMVARKLADQKVWICASPAYVAQHGTPREPGDLERHHCLHYTYWASGAEWRLEKDGAVHLVKVAGPMRGNNGDLLRCAALDGLGIIMQPDFIVGDDIRAGRLLPLLPDYIVAPIGVHVLYPHRRYLSAKVRAFAAHLTECFGEGGAQGAAA